MDSYNALVKLKEYNESINLLKCSSLEKEFIKGTSREYFFYHIPIVKQKFPKTLEAFLCENNNFSQLFKGRQEKLCFYLSHIQEYTYGSQLIRMDVRSRDFSHYWNKVIAAITGFYLFYALELDLKKLIYGEYRELPIYVDMAPVISTEIMQGNEEVIRYCMDVFMSENNIAVVTRNVIKAVEQANHKELHKMLLDLFLAAKLQEGLRQSIIETIDEHQLDLYLSFIELIKEHGLLRFSSVQRGIMTWIGIGYENVEEKNIRMIFDTLYLYLHDLKALEEGFESENPLKVYLALYCIGIYDVENATRQALKLLKHEKKHIVASAGVYMKMTRTFSPVTHLYLADRGDEWILALYLSECCGIDFSREHLPKYAVERIYHHIWNFVQSMKSQQTYQSKGFEWFSVVLDKNVLIFSMFQLLQQVHTQEMAEMFLPYVSTLHSKNLKVFMEKFYPLISTKKQKAFLLKEVISSNSELSQYAATEYKKLVLSEEEMVQLESRLKSKKAYARANIIKILAAQKKELVLKSYERLHVSKSKIIYESALELKQLVPKYFPKEQVPEIVIKGKREGFSLYEPKKIYEVPCESHLKMLSKGVFLKKETVDVGFLQVWPKQQVLGYIKRWSRRIDEHALAEYESGGECRQIGQRFLYPINYSKKTLDALPLGDVWRQYFIEDGFSEDVIFQLMFHIHNVGTVYNSFLPKEIGLFSLEEHEIRGIDYYAHYCLILQYYFEEVNHDSFPEKAFQYLELMNRYAKVCQYEKKGCQWADGTFSLAEMDEFRFMIGQLRLMEASEEEFLLRFPVLYQSYERFHINCKEETHGKLDIPFPVLARAVNLQIIPKEVLYEALLDTHTCSVKGEHFYYGNRGNRLMEAYREAYFHGRVICGKPDFSIEEANKETTLCIRDALDHIVEVLLSMERGRINEVTDVTSCVQCLSVIRGMKYLIMALHILEKEDIRRSSIGTDRNTIFSNVIRNCYPQKEDTPELLKQEGFSEKRLVEVAMMAPQWIDIIQEILGWEGFKEACYYFIAHMKQYDYDRKKAQIVHYTDIDPIDLNDGAFDMVWCKKIYHLLGEKNFSMVYQAAKFLCENSFHTRARKYADACLGKQKKEVFLEQAKEKRNKDALNAYCICPLESDQDLLERYLYVQQFLKESRTFGSQRQTSEKRACEIALMNLARNSRYETVTRLSWIMETKVMQKYSNFLKPLQVDDVEIWIAIDEFGKNEICVRKGLKKLKSIPDRLKKHEKILEIKEVHTLLNHQYKRSREMLQNAMEERIIFGRDEIEAISSNPVIAPMLKNLVLKNHGHFGFYKEGMLQGLKETNAIYGDVYIAHPYDLYEEGVWSGYQMYVFENRLVQPFKQIFRELYLKLPDEQSYSYTKRYSGYQIQPQKAVSILKSRKWNASYESGLEKVFHKENLVVYLAANADWFAPSDIEAPSIDYVEFCDQRNGDQRLIKDIDDVVYSEIMRDIDLVVSTAYVGGVDPITSLSTMELRKAIIEYTCQLMKLENVTVQKHFVNIEGKHNNYHVHLGSGMIHQDGGNSIHMVPVFSGKRGKVYLPFLDEDPMSAQILTKVLMLAEDTKIKDPSILSQIVTKN